jgi:molybdate/tungstate transport system substrate-binding protein
MMYSSLRKLLMLALLVFALQACWQPHEERLVIFHAGSLSYPLREMAREFENDYPHIKVVSEAAGSVHTIRKVTDLKRNADIIASADYQLINKMLIPDYAAFNLLFATNGMVLAFTDKAAFADEIDTANWIQILQREGVKKGASDPHADPCGYRTRLLLLLAEKYYGQKELIPAILSGPDYYERPKETDLLALLETQTIDYIFIYESVAVQHGLRYLKLPDSVNLSNPHLDQWYAGVSVNIRGSRPNETIVMLGESITYGITLLNEAPNRQAADMFLEWLLNPEKGGLVLERSGQGAVFPAEAYGYNELPGNLKKFSKNKTIH